MKNKILLGLVLLSLLSNISMYFVFFSNKNKQDNLEITKLKVSIELMNNIVMLDKRTKILQEQMLKNVEELNRLDHNQKLLKNAIISLY
jgi:hypothetical protein